MRRRLRFWLSPLLWIGWATPVLAWVSTDVPDFRGPVLGSSGTEFHLADHVGREMIVLNFFQTYCGPCREELPALSRFAQAHAADPVRVVGVDPGEGTPTILNFTQWLKLAFPVLPDSGELKRRLAVGGYPFTLVIGVDGSIQLQHLDPIDVDRDLVPLLALNQKLLAAGRGLASADFLAARERAGQKPIVLAALEARAIAGYIADPSKRNEIFGIKVVSDNPTRIEVEVDYFYTGDHGDSRIYVDCDPQVPGKGAPFGMLPIAVAVGRHTGRAPLSAYGGTPDGVQSTTVKCDMSSRIDQARLTSFSIDYKKEWKK